MLNENISSSSNAIADTEIKWDRRSRRYPIRQSMQTREPHKISGVTREPLDATQQFCAPFNAFGIPSRYFVRSYLDVMCRHFFQHFKVTIYI